MVGRLREHGSGTEERTWYDTFDWRLHGKGYCLEELREGEGNLLLLKHLPGRRVFRRLRAPSPRIAGQLPRSSLRDLVAGITEPRILLPLAVVATGIRRFEVTDGEGGRIAAMDLAEHRAGLPGGAPRPLLRREVRLEAAAGEARRARQLTAFLRISLGLIPPERSLFEEAMRAVGRVPGDYSSKVAVSLDPLTPSGEAVRHILQHLLGIMERNVEGAMEGEDPEFLHDFRVAVRRTRSALSQLEGVLDPEAAAPFRSEFAWLQQVTGPARDMDVHSLALPAYREHLPPDARRELAPLAAYLADHRKKAHDEVREALDSGRFAELRKGWRAFLDDPPEGGQGPLAGSPVGQVSAERIWKVSRRALKEGRAIEGKSPPEDLHELRKTCKKLRYLLEFFRSIYPGGAVDKLVGSLKVLQEDLGDFQDLQVQSEALEKIAREMLEEGTAPAGTFMAMGRLVEGLRWRSLRARERFEECFEEFARPRNRRLFRKHFKRQGTGKGKETGDESREEDGQGDREEVPRQG